MHVISRRNGKRVVFGFIPVPAAVLLGSLGAVAVAAVILTTTVGGSLTIKNVGTSNSIQLTGSADSGSALDCSKIEVPTPASITLKPVLTKTTNGTNATSTDPILGGDCTINLEVKNTGTKSIKVDITQTNFTAPKGIVLGAVTGDALSPITPGQTRTLSVKLTANESADGSGEFGGKIVYTDAA